MTDLPVTLVDIEAAASRIDGALVRTSCHLSRSLSAITGCELYLKFENQQFTASFKERGALNKLLELGPEQRALGVCAMSAGNHAQGLAYHAKRLGIPTTIFMARGTPFTKVGRTRDHGAEVVIEGANLTEAMQAAESWATETGAVLVHPYDDAAVIAGQGTLGLEMIESVRELDDVVVPIGGGGVISGVAIAVKAVSPSTKVIGVQTRAYPSMVNALAGEEAPCADQVTVAEGMAVKTAGHLTRRIVRELVDDILLVDEASIEHAVALLLNNEKTVVEGAGAAGLAAIREYPNRFAGKRVATPLCGGNIDLRVLSSVALRELIRNRQLVRFTVPIKDHPGALGTVTAIIGEGGGNILEVGHDRLSLALNVKGAILDVVTEVQGALHADTLIDALTSRGFAPTILASA